MLKLRDILATANLTPSSSNLNLHVIKILKQQQGCGDMQWDESSTHIKSIP